MRTILKTLLKLSARGDTLYEAVEEVVDDEPGTLAESKREVLSLCASCGQPLEPNQVQRNNCPLCGQ